MFLKPGAKNVNEIRKVAPTGFDEGPPTVA